MEDAYVCIVQTSEVTGVLLTLTGKTEESKTYMIQGFETLKEGLRYFEDSYNRAHGRGYEASMSACINGIFFRPSILKLSIPDLKKHLEEGVKPVTVRNISGSMTLLPMVDATALWESGSKPRLISDPVEA